MKLCLGLLVLILVSCQNKQSMPIKKTSTVYIQPVGNVHSSLITSVKNQLAKYFPNVAVRSGINPPAFAYYAARNRYRADSLIAWLDKQTRKDDVTIGITDLDISTKKNEHADWGVMGLAFRPGKACVVSTFRLTQGKKSEQLFKVAIHELGHTQGLPHCSVKSCYMRDAEGGNPTDEERSFCKNCHAFLLSQGWKM